MKIVLSGKPFWVNFHHLYCFFVIASEGGLTAASRRLGIGPSALSIQLRNLEQSLEATLFDRSGRKMSPSEHGRVLYSYAKEIFRLGGEMVEAMKDRPASGRAHLQIGALDTIPKHLTLNLALSALKGGKCAISVVEGKSDELFRQLLDHKIDLMLTNFKPPAAGAPVFHRRIARLPLWIAGSRAFVGLKKKFPESLAGKPFILPTADSDVRQEIDSFFQRSGVVPDVVAESQDVMVQKLLALSGVGMTVVPDFAIRDYLKEKRLFLIGRAPDCYEELYMVTATRRVENPVASRLMKSFTIA